ncbi:MAG: SLC13 family permease [Candidatus Rokuibacteriota bacterium]
MDLTTALALVIFLATIAAVVTGVIETTVAALLGVGLMVWVGIMTEREAFLYVDWNVMAILVSIWIIAGYFGKTGVPEWLAARALRLSGGRPGRLVMILSFLSGVLSMFIDNVVVILMMAPVAIPLARHLGMPLLPVVLMIGFSANFMGTALLLGDLPPQMLHSVSGAEFMDFIWFQGRPSSFPILMVTFLITLAAMYVYAFRTQRAVARTGVGESLTELGIDSTIRDRRFATIVIGFFAATVVAMAFREVLDVLLGFIALSGALALVLTLEIVYRHRPKPEFETILTELDWRAILFYIALFSLVGGLEKVGILEHLAHALTPLFRQNLLLGATLLYWVTIPIVGIVEHDAYILTFLYTIRDLKEQGVDPWPLWWMLVWAGTLGSNLTVAGAPALFVALNICEREDKCKIPLRQFLRYSVPFTVVACVVCYVLGVLVWVLPYA